MTNRTNSWGKLALVAGTAVTTLVLAACGAASEDVAAVPAAAGSTAGHSGHAYTGPAPEIPLRKGERFVDIGMPQSYTPVPPNGGTDEYRCIVVDPQTPKPEFLTGSQFMPKNGPIVHHANVYLVSPANAAKARAKDAETPGEGWTCFGTDGLNTQSESAWVDTWTPGSEERLLTQDVGFRMEPGGLVILQMHYNLLATDGKPGESDQSHIRLRLTDGTPKTKPLIQVPLMAPIELPCAAGESGPLCDRDASLADIALRFGPEVAATEPGLVARCSGGKVLAGNTQQCDTSIPAPMTIYAGRGHMHLLGRSIKVELNPGTPQAQTLLDVPEFDFDDQQRVPLPKPVQVAPGQKVRVTCTHDASLRQKLPALKKLPPRYVVYGDGTSDEMCIGLMTVTIP